MKKSFDERLACGYSGEQIIEDYLIGEGWILYRPENHPHPFDFLCYKNGSSFIAEVKTKPKMKLYNATGIDYRHYIIYRDYQEKHNLPVFIFFVDYSLNLIYGNYLNELDKPYTQIESGKRIVYPIINRRHNIITFPLSAMRLILYT